MASLSILCEIIFAWARLSCPFAGIYRGEGCQGRSAQTLGLNESCGSTRVTVARQCWRLRESCDWLRRICVRLRLCMLRAVRKFLFSRETRSVRKFRQQSAWVRSLSYVGFCLSLICDGILYALQSATKSMSQSVSEFTSAIEFLSKSTRTAQE